MLKNIIQLLYRYNNNFFIFCFLTTYFSEKNKINTNKKIFYKYKISTVDVENSIY